MNELLTRNIQRLLSPSPALPAKRQESLEQITEYIHARQTSGAPVYLNFICTHNSRRSQISQLLAMAAAKHFQVSGVQCFSGGTEATAFNNFAIQALQNFGFEIERLERKEINGDNPRFSWKGSPKTELYSKVYNQAPNPGENYCAVMTCSHADTNCPVVSGADKRISLPFNDPKSFDDSADPLPHYENTIREIGAELFFAFGKL